MKIIATISLILMILSSTHSQWVANYYAPASGDANITNARGNSVKVDNSGKVYIGGSSGLANNQDILVIKYKNNGDTAWARTYNGSENMDDQAFGIAVDESENVYVVGTARNNKNFYDFVVLKYNSNGNLIWDKKHSGVKNGEDKGVSIVLDKYGNIFVTGYAAGSDLKFDMVTMKYSPSGTLLWSKSEDGDAHLNTKGQSIALDSDENVYVTGYTTTSNNGTDIIAVKYSSSNGEKLWSKSYNGNGNSEDKAWGIIIDGDKYVYIAGYTTRSNNNIDAITLQYACDNGQEGFAKTFNGSGDAEDRAWGIIVDNDSYIYVTGFTTAANGNVNYVTLSYNEDGSLRWGPKEYNGPGNGVDKANAITLVYAGNSNNLKSIAVTGGSAGQNNNYDYATVTYNPSNGTQKDVVRYSLDRNSDDVALDIKSNNNSLYVTGYSELKFGNSNEISSRVASTQMTVETDANGSNTINNTPEKFELQQNYPNPFNPSTTIKFSIPDASGVKLAVYDMLGRVVDVLVNQNLDAGTYSITYTNNKLASGIYFYELTAGSFRDIKKMTLVK